MWGAHVPVLSVFYPPHFWLFELTELHSWLSGSILLSCQFLSPALGISTNQFCSFLLSFYLNYTDVLEAISKILILSRKFSFTKTIWSRKSKKSNISWCKSILLVLIVLVFFLAEQLLLLLRESEDFVGFFKCLNSKK